MIRHVIEAGYEDYLKDQFANYRARREDLEQMALFAMQFESVEDFLTQLALLTNLESEDAKPGVPDEEAMRLSTVHQAKGLEFDVVFLIMLCDGLFPSTRSLETKDGEEEERRLFYVAVTRARDELYLCHPLVRSASSGGVMLQEKSRFLRELPPELLDDAPLAAGSHARTVIQANPSSAKISSAMIPWWTSAVLKAAITVGSLTLIPEFIPGISLPAPLIQPVRRADIPSPVQAASASALSFTSGALLPMLAILLLPASLRVPVTFAAVLIALGLTGALSARLGGSNVRRAVLRVIIGGALGLAFTYGIGHLFGTAIG